MDGLAAAGLITEFLTWIGLAVGITLYIAGVSVRVVGRRWTATDGIVADVHDGSGTRVLRWFDREGDVHEAVADTPETHELPVGSDVRLWFSPRQPWRSRTHAPELDGRALRVTGLVLTGIGVLGAVSGIALLFLE